jgi:hypothetical protein
MINRTKLKRSETVLRALSIRQPWAWLILHAGKYIENRDWQPRNPGLRFRGRCLVHASLKLEPIDDELRERVRRTSGVEIPQPGELPRGGIVGQVDVIDIVQQSPSPWFEGPCGLVLTNARSLPFRACRGLLGFFEPLLPQLPADCRVSANITEDGI